MAGYDTESNNSEGVVTNSNDVSIEELENVTEVEDSALFIVQDSQNTKTINLTSLRRNLISDGDIPSDTKIYSSEKIQSMIKDHEDKLNAELAETNTTLDSVVQNYAKTETVNNQIQEIKDTLFTTEDKKEIEEALDLKRDKAIPIMSSDLDKSSDAARIHMDNLGEDVLSAITGETPVSLVKSPEGGWTTESYANKSITADKLSSSYRYRGIISEGSINDIVDDGVYVLGPQVEGVPKYSDDDVEDKYLIVTLFGRNKEFIEQRVEYIYQTEDRPFYIRKGKRLTLPSLSFVARYTVTDTFRLNVDMFGDVLTDRGVIESGSIFDHTAEGNYKVLAGVENMPTTTDEYFVTITKSHDYYIYEAKLNSINSCVIYVCYVHLNEYGITVATNWFKITSINKSKFDNQRIHIFGDGIAYGHTDSNVADSSTTYPSLLFSEYGFRVFNHAQNDATVGNYGVKTIEERSVLTQIQNTSFEDNDFAIIFAGTNDFKIGSCPLGNDSDERDTTFKGSLNLAIRNIFEKNKTIRLLIITPLFRSRMDSGDNRDSDTTRISGRMLKDYSDAIKTVSEINHIPVLDMYGSGLINKYNSEHWLYDGLYLSQSGHSMFATMLYNKLNGLY